MKTEALEGSDEAPELVPNGLGALRGLEPLQHVAWAEKVEHPASHLPDKVTLELLGALEFECGSEVENIEDFRRERLYQFIRQAKHVAKAQADWAAQAPQSIQPVVGALYGPPLKWALTWATGSEDTFAQLLSDCQQDFPLLEDLPPCEGAVLEGLPKSFPKGNLEGEDLRNKRENVIR